MPHVSILSTIIVANGIYNLIMALTILDVINLPSVRNMYFDMITEYDNNNFIFERFVAYSMLANGLIRIFNGISLEDKASQYVVAGSYFLEALFLANEYFVYHKVHRFSAWITIVFSIYLGYSIILNKF